MGAVALQQQQQQQFSQTAVSNIMSSTTGAPQIGILNLTLNQPQIPVVWVAPASFPLPNYAPGLEYFLHLDKILIQQEVVGGNTFGGKNRYRILNEDGKQMFIAAENPTVNMSTHQARSFIIQLFDQQKVEVMRVIRESAPCGCACCICCCKSCAIELKVEAPPGTLLGIIRQQPRCCRISLGVLDAKENIHLNFEIPVLFGTTGNVVFPILSIDTKEQTGSIIKFYTGELQEYLTKADNFGVYFPADLDLNLKALLLGSVFLIDFQFFESQPGAFQRRRHRPY